MPKYIERKEYNNVISIKIVIPGGCNAHCYFCYMKDYKGIMLNNTEQFLKNFIPSLVDLLDRIGDKNPVSIDITGNEPTYNPEVLIDVLQQLKENNIKSKVSRITMTTNGYKLREVIPYLEGVVDYVNISVHSYDMMARGRIMGCDPFKDGQYKLMVYELSTIGIKASAVSIIDEEISYFNKWYLKKYIYFCKDVGFISLRFRRNVFNIDIIPEFEKYMEETMNDKYNYQIITHEKTPDSHWCRLRRRWDGFRVSFLNGVLDTSLVTKGIEYIIADDGLAYCDYYKRVPIDKYEYEIGKIYDIADESQESNRKLSMVLFLAHNIYPLGLSS